MATYYVSKIGSNTVPYDTQEKAANTIAAVISHIALNNETGSTIYVSAGEYIVNYAAQISLSSEACAGLSIIGSGCNSTVFYGNDVGLHISSTSGDNILIEGVRFKPGAGKSAYIKQGGANGITLRDVIFEAVDGSTAGTFINISGDTSSLWERVGILWRSNDAVVSINTNQTNLNVRWCYSRCIGADAVKATNGAWVISGPATVNIDHSVILDSRTHGILVTGAFSTVKIRNSIVSGGISNGAAYTINKISGEVSNENGFLIGPPLGPASARTTNGVVESNTHKNIPPRIKPAGRIGFVIPHVDDSGNYLYAKALEEELRARGMRGGFYIEPYAYANTVPDNELKGFVSRGVMEICSHTLTHTALTYTHALHCSNIGGSNPTVSFDGETIYLTCAEPEFSTQYNIAGKNIGDIILELNGKNGWTVAKSSTGGQNANNIYNKCLASSLKAMPVTAAPCDIDFDTDPVGGKFFQNELALSKAIIEEIIGNTFDPQTGLSYRCNSLGAPYNTQSTDSKNFSRNIAEYTSVRATAHALSNQLLSQIDIYEIYPILASSLVGVTADITRQNAIALGFAAAVTGMVFPVLAHNEAECSIANWKIILDAWANISDLIVTSQQLVSKHIRESGDWNEISPGVWRREWAAPEMGVLKLNDYSPLVHGGKTITGVNDAGQLDPWGNVTSSIYPNIGADQYGRDQGKGPWKTFDGTMPSITAPIADQDFIIDQVQVWKTRPTVTQIEKVLG